MNRIIASIGLLFIYSCSARLADMDARDFINWYRSNTELTLTRTFGENEFCATYKAPEIIYLMENKKNKPLLKIEFEKRKKELGELYYFNFKIKPGQNNDLFAAAGIDDVNYPLDLMQYDFYLVQENDTAHCVLFHFERTYGIAKGTDISLAFDNTKINKLKDFTLVFNDELFNSGLNKFKFSASAINTIPKLRL